MLASPKTPSSTLDNDDGIDTSLSRFSPAKAPVPISVTDSGIETFAKNLQS